MNGKQMENRQQKKTETPDSASLQPGHNTTGCLEQPIFYTRADFIFKEILCDDDENTNISDIRKDWTSVSSQIAALPVMCLRGFSLFYKHCCAIECTGC